MISFNTEKSRIAIFRALQLGDMLCSVPAMRALRAQYPKAEISLIGLPWAGAFVNRFNKYLDRHVVFPGYPGLPEQPFSSDAWDVFILKMQQESFDLIIQMQGNGTIVNEMLTQFQARQLAGFHRPDCAMDPATFLEYPEGQHEVMRHLLLMRHLGIPDKGTELEFPITIEEEEELRKILPFVHEQRFVCVHPGSRDATRQWPPEFFARLADDCAETGLRVVLTGTSDETHLTDQVAKEMKHAALDLAGKTSLGVAGALIGASSLLIANCTGVSHISAATKTPSVIISMDGEPERWGPMDRELHQVFDWTTRQSFEEIQQALARFLRRLKENDIRTDAFAKQA